MKYSQVSHRIIAAGALTDTSPQHSTAIMSITASAEKTENQAVDEYQNVYQGRVSEYSRTVGKSTRYHGAAGTHERERVC